MTRNHWIRVIEVRRLNVLLAVKVKPYCGQDWTDELKKKISKIAFNFMNDHNLDDSFSFAVEIEKNVGTVINANSIFRGIRILT